ncbi:MAG: hypothetical protein HY706_14645 [Candidatus Hydrogenedentes bacterium]|nr:hypothetical protein [Candidatus Hydrogenedentota bacterium]
MKTISPSLQEWKILYDLAVEFRKLECWKWMQDNDLFGVQHPDTGQVGYCSVMGNLGEHFALAVYPGSEGLESYMQVLVSETEEDALDAVLRQRCLAVSFENRKQLEREDLEVIDALSLQFKGRNNFPVFRSHRAGYVPWFLDKEHVSLLAVTLEQTMEVAAIVKGQEDFLKPPEGEMILMVRTPARDSAGLRWENRWHRPEPLPFPKEDTSRFDELHVRRLKNRSGARKAVWEVDMFYTPAPVKEEGPPYYPYTLAIMEHFQGIALGVEMASPSDYRETFRKKLLDVMEQMPQIPHRILVKRPEASAFVRALVTDLGIEVVHLRDLPALADFRRGMVGFMSSR